MTSLMIAHNIFLTRKQRYDLFEGLPVETIGITVPVWCSEVATSEPAPEIFCNYKITNSEKMNHSIRSLRNGYSINLPETWSLKDVADGGSEWMNLTQTSKIRKGTRSYTVQHVIEIKPLEALLTTLA